MAHFAQIDSYNMVTFVTPVNDSRLQDSDGNEDTNPGVVAHLEATVGPGPWKRTYKDGSSRGTYASYGYYYYPVFDVFAPARPHNSWLLNTDNGKWFAPIEEPALTDAHIAAGQLWTWNEDAYQADTGVPKTAGWELYPPSDD